MSDLDEAIALYVGWTIARHPQENAARVVDRFGEARGSELVVRVQSLLDELQATPIDWQVHTLVSGSGEAACSMKRRYPDLDARSIAAMRWLMSWWWR